MDDRSAFLDPELTRHWRYYLLLEAEFERALEYVEPDHDNAATYSLQFCKQLLSACAQFETVARLFCRARGQQEPKGGIVALRASLVACAPGLTAWRTRFHPLNEQLAPFSGWTDSAPPEWWSAYNKLKHEPAGSIRYATLQNVTMALAAVGLVTLAYLNINAQPGRSRLFDLDWA